MKKPVLFFGKEQPLHSSQNAVHCLAQSSAFAVLESWNYWRRLSTTILKMLSLVLVCTFWGMTQASAQFYDLSLAQSVDKDSVGIGDTVVFTLTVNHEAGATATGIVVTDSVSSGLTVFDVGTPSNGGTATMDVGTNKLTWSLADIAAADGSSTLIFRAIVNGEGIYFNVAEITTSANDSDSNADNQNYLEDDIAAACVSVPIKLCTGTQDSILISAPAGATSVQWYRVFDFNNDGVIGVGDTMALASGNSVAIDSIGTYYFTAALGSCQAGNCCPLMVEPACMDLALTKTLATAGTIISGDTVAFTIKVYNQGTIFADSIELVDYLPDSLNLVVENGWTLTGLGDTTATKLLAVGNGALSAGGLAPTDSVEVSLRAVIPVDFRGTSLVNFAEIGNQTDIYGNDLKDVDSNDDTDRTNDSGGIPNSDTDNITDNSNGDEDDHDPALVTVQQTFDLALKKTLAIGQSTTVSPGDTVNYQVTIYNQGTQIAYNINVVDYTPAGMTLVTGGIYSPNWISGSPNATFYNAGPLAVGDSIVAPLSFRIADNFMGTSITNAAEISSADNDTNNANGQPEDTDSSPDALNNETNLVDDEITQNGKSGGDEDDHDIALVNLTQRYDLALTKILVDKGTPYRPGDTATFRIYVHNQGTLTVAANTVKVRDYIPTDMILADNDWLAADSSYTFPNAIAAGSMDSVDIDLQIAPNFMGTSITNNAEI
ncbi:MAG: DUF11 domain-containing protein, partial [Bacteroidota bacterium]